MIDWGELRRTTPIARSFGFDRGHPVDRRYIEAFLERHRDDVRGRVLEIGDRGYTRRFGGDRVTRSDVYDLPGNDGAALPPAAFDCMIVTQTLLFVFDVRRALSNLRDALAPGGVLLVTVPGIS